MTFNCGIKQSECDTDKDKDMLTWNKQDLHHKDND